MGKGINFLLSLLIAGGIHAQQGSRRVELKEVIDGTFRQETATGELRSTPDGEHYTAMNRERTMLVRYAYRTSTPVDTLFDVHRARECTFEDFEGYEISSTGHRILIWRAKEAIYRRSYRADVYVYDVRRNMVQPLHEAGGKVMIPTFSPDGRMCAFVVDNNIRLKKFDFDTEIPVTKDGVFNRIINGATDWVYEEEFSVTNLMAWSSDSEYLAFVRFDESEVPEYSMQTYGDGYYPGEYTYKYPKAGEKNSTVTLHSYSVETKDIKTLHTPVDAESYIPRIAFTSQPDQLAVMTLNRHQNVFHLHYANPKSGIFRLILKEENKCYIDSDWLNRLLFTKDGFLYVSEKDGYAHICQYSATGVEQRRVTQGNWDVTALLGIDETTNTVYYESAEESPLRRSVYRVDAKGVKTRLSTQEGTSHATFSKNFAFYVNHYSNANTPAVITLNETKTGKVLRVLQDNAGLKERLEKYAYTPKEFLRIQTASGVELNAWMVKPANFSESKKYPVVMFQYGGPNSQSALDQYD
ncbi:MAG: DPP IV N-terminal domain-containing protein, partial [Tannerella sp.]|nr:DPP IV N-terminal domain-containing protein [Tannerella sp.]